MVVVATPTRTSNVESAVELDGWSSHESNPLYAIQSRKGRRSVYLVSLNIARDVYRALFA